MNGGGRVVTAASGFMIKFKETGKEKYEGFYSPLFKGKVFRVFSCDREIGVLFLELFEIEGLKCGTFHVLILPSYRNFKAGTELIERIYHLAFSDLGLDKLYTMTNEAVKEYFIKRGKMKDERRKIGEYNIFSLTRGDYAGIRGSR